MLVGYHHAAHVGAASLPAETSGFAARYVHIVSTFLGPLVRKEFSWCVELFNRKHFHQRVAHPDVVKSGLLPGAPATDQQGPGLNKWYGCSCQRIHEAATRSQIGRDHHRPAATPSILTQSIRCEEGR